MGSAASRIGWVSIRGRRPFGVGYLGECGREERIASLQAMITCAGDTGGTATTAPRSDPGHGADPTTKPQVTA